MVYFKVRNIAVSKIVHRIIQMSPVLIRRLWNIGRRSDFDSIGYQELPIFLKLSNYLKAVEMQMEDNYGMIDGIIHNDPKETEIGG